MRLRHFFLFSLLTTCSFGQNTNPNVDPLALQVLRATMDSIQNAGAFSFRAVVNRELLGTHDEVLTFSQQSEVTIARPDRFRIRVTSDLQPLDIYYNAGQVTLFAPDKNLYSGFLGGPVLDLYISKLEERGIQLPMSSLFRTDPYKTLTDDLERAAVIGRDEIDGKTYHHLSFGEKQADWQLWVEAGTKPTPRRAEIVYKTLRREPRVTIEFFDWNLAANPPASLFVFPKPDDAKYIDFLEATNANPQSVIAQVSSRGDTRVYVHNRSTSQGGDSKNGTVDRDSDWNWSSFAVGGAPDTTPSTAAATLTAPAVGAVVSRLPGGCSPVTGSKVALYDCKSVYYRPFYQGSTLVYQVTVRPSNQGDTR